MVTTILDGRCNKRKGICLTLALAWLLLLLTLAACKTNNAVVVPGQITIAQIIQETSKFEGKVVGISGQYMGWHSENGYGPPVTRSDWVIKDSTGEIYVTGQNPGLDPVADVGCPIVVKGTVRVTDKDIPYIEVAGVDIEKEE